MLRLSPLLSRPATLAMLALLAACQTPRSAPERPRPVVTVQESESWREAALDEDAALIDALPATWIQALAESRRRYGRAVSAEGALLVPGAALPQAAPAPGPYRCRALQIGTRVPAGRAWSVSRSGFCFVGVEDDQLSLSSEIAGLRFGGYLWAVKGGARLVFLGAATPARAKAAPAYGDNLAANRVGQIERTAEFRYRLVLPNRAGDSRLTIIEMIAAPAP